MRLREANIMVTYVREGEIVEPWDVRQSVLETPANDNAMFTLDSEPWTGC